MIRKLLATTAIASLIATGAIAQTPPAATDPAPAETEAAAPVAPADGQLASNLIGETVYNGTGDDAEKIGTVNDLVLTDEGQIESIVVGVGGFLGIGEKNVALSYDEVDWAERDGDRWIVLPTTADALKELPAFDRRAYDPAPAGGATAPATDTAPAPADGGAMAPAATPAAPAASETTSEPAATETPAPPAAGEADEAAVDRTTLTAVPAEDLTSENLVGTTVYGANDENVGDIGDVVLTADGKVDAVIIDVGGFLGIGEKPVAVGFDNLEFMQDTDNNRYLYTQFTKEQLESQPEYDEGTWEAERDQQRLNATP